MEGGRRSIDPITVCAKGLSQEVLYPSGFLAIISFAVTLRASTVLFQVKRLHAMRSIHVIVGACHHSIATVQDHKIIRRARRASTSLEIIEDHLVVSELLSSMPFLQNLLHDTHIILICDSKLLMLGHIK